VHGRADHEHPYRVISSERKFFAYFELFATRAGGGASMGLSILRKYAKTFFLSLVAHHRIPLEANHNCAGRARKTLRKLHLPTMESVRYIVVAGL
jgi:hypothetical protein